MLDFAEPYGAEVPDDAYHNWMQKAAKSSCNYAFHMTLPRWENNTARQMESTVANGITSFKVYTTYDMMLDDASLVITSYSIHYTKLYDHVRTRAPLVVVMLSLLPGPCLRGARGRRRTDPAAHRSP